MGRPLNAPARRDQASFSHALRCEVPSLDVVEIWMTLSPAFSGYRVMRAIRSTQAKPRAPNRRHFQACKLRLRLGGSASLTAPFPARPPGMHRQTYARLRRRAEKLESRLSARLRSKAPDYPSLVYYFP
jgi:hypothetical protein